MRCDITSPDLGSYLAARPLPDDFADLSSTDQAAAITSATLVISVGDDEKTFVLTEKSDSRQAASGESTYQFVAESPAVLLDAPYALPVTVAYPAGVLSDIAASIIAFCPSFTWDFTWALEDDFIPADTLYANDETPLMVLRKLSDALGGMLQSDPAGSFRAALFYPASVPLWPVTSPERYLSDTGDFFTIGSGPDHRPGYNKFIVSDHTPAADGLRLTEKAIDPWKKEIRAYLIPWSDQQPPLDTSGPARVTIQAPEIAEEAITGEQVEIVNGSGRTTLPIYRMDDRDYGDNLQLGALDWSEDGSVTSEVKGQSLCLASYTTKFWKWIVADTAADTVQLWTSQVWDDMPVTIVVQFGDAVASGASIIVEPDDTLNVNADKSVKSEFAPGDPFFFLAQHDDTVRITASLCSSGSLSYLGMVGRAKSQQQVFIDKNPVELPTRPSGGISAKWYGRSPGLTISGKSVSADQFPAIGELSWSAAMHSYKLTPPPLSLSGEQKYYIVVLIQVESV